MLSLEFRSLIGASWGDLAVDIRSMQVLDAAGDPIILAVNGPSGGVLSFCLSADSDDAVLIDSVVYNTSMSYAVTGGSTVIKVESGSIIAVLGGTSQDGTFGFSVQSNGQIGSSTKVGLPEADGLTGPVIAVAQSGFVYAMNAADKLQCFAPDGAGGYQAGASYGDTGDLYLQNPVAMATVQLAGKEFLLTLSGTEQGVSAFSISQSTGALTTTGSLGVASGLGLLSDPTAMEAVEVDGHRYILVTSSADTGEGGALTALELHNDGSLSVTDHLIDTLDTRFGRTQSMTATQIGDWTYIVAGGGDAGLSLFTLASNGQLIHLDSLADTLDSGLENISALTTVSSGDQLDILVSSDKTSGLSRLTVSLANQGAVLSTDSGRLDGTSKDDMLIGGTGNSDLRGGAGADILIDGWGQDSLSGGAGADFFVLNADDKRDVITDFDASIDHLDLTAIPMLYDTSRLSVTETSWGAVLTFRGGEETEIRSADGKTLTADRIFQSIDWNANRPPMVLTSGEDDSTPDDVVPDDLGNTDTNVPGGLHGGSQNDTLIGGDDADSIYGSGGDDWLEGQNGRDLIFGEEGNDWMHGGAHNDTMLGGNGDDSIYGAFGNDSLEGENGNDSIAGGGGKDWLNGGAQNDTLFGNGGADTIYGEDGNDRLDGGYGTDSMFGGAGNDWMHGGGKSDTLVGGNGNDTLYGAYGFDTLDGGDGHDSMLGGSGEDSLAGGGGNDWMHGGARSDALLGGDGDDTLYGAFGYDTLDGGNGDDVISGGGGNDFINGGSGNDELFGNAGRDAMFGGGGDDVLSGGGGKDWLEGGSGYDLLTGGLDSDGFAFDALSDRNEITDFIPGVDYLVLDISEKSFDALAMTNSSQGVWLEWHGGEVLLQGLSVDDISSSDVIIV
ncbi:calcium-binding protein [Thioclava sp.]|uniref:calcium-binding protein n=1 Tax=Thioclava sp. TaxID=1933450 RepID=UPI003AA902A8